MIKNKFSKGDLVCTKAFGQGLVVDTGKIKERYRDIVGACDYVEVKFIGVAGYRQFFRNSLGWKQTEVLARGKENEQQ